MCNSAAHLLALGYPVLRLNLRGAGPSRPLCRFQYHGGRTGDFAAALAALPATVTASGVIAIGYSLGGNMLLKFLGERGRAAPLAGGGVGVGAARSRVHLAADAAERRNGLNRRPPDARNAHRGGEAGVSNSLLPARAPLAAWRAHDLGIRRTLHRAAQWLCRCRRLLRAPLGAAFSRRDRRADAWSSMRLDDPWVPADPYRAVAWDGNPHVAAAVLAARRAYRLLWRRPARRRGTTAPTQRFFDAALNRP